MKKINKKLLLSATLFTAALNMNGCAYGPPPDEAMYLNEPQIVETEEVVNHQLEDEIANIESDEHNAEL